MKILVFASSAFPRWKTDPSPSFVYDLSLRLKKSGADVVVLAPHAPGSRRFEVIGGMRVYRFRYFFPSSLERLCYGAGILPNMKASFIARLQLPFLLTSELVSLLRVCIKEKPGVIHAHWILPQGFAAAIASRLTGIPVVMTAHAGDVFPLNKPLFRILSRFALSSASAVTVNSAFTKNAVARLTKKPIGIIPMGVDLRLFSSASKLASSEVRKKLGIWRNGKVLLFVGRLVEKKGVSYLISAMPSVVHKFPDCKLVIVGDGIEKKSLMQQVVSLGLSKNVIFTGSVQNSELPAYYRASDVFILPSIVAKGGDTEGLGVVLLEAIAAGIPVIASNVGGIPDIVINQRTGILVDQKDAGQLSAAIEKLLGSHQLARNLSRSARAHVVKNFSWDSASRSFWQVFKSLLG